LRQLARPGSVQAFPQRTQIGKLPKSPIRVRTSSQSEEHLTRYVILKARAFSSGRRISRVVFHPKRCPRRPAHPDFSREGRRHDKKFKLSSRAKPRDLLSARATMMPPGIPTTHTHEQLRNRPIRAGVFRQWRKTSSIYGDNLEVLRQQIKDESVPYLVRRNKLDPAQRNQIRLEARH